MRSCVLCLGLAIGTAVSSMACVPTYDFAADNEGGTVEDGGADVAADVAPKNDGPTGTDAADAALHADASPPDGGADGDAAPAVSLQGCVLLMHMDEASWTGAAGAVKDASGQGNDGTAKGTATTTPSGKFGAAGMFDGSGYVTVPDAASLHVTNGLTYSAWVYPTGLGNDQKYPGILSKRYDYTTDVAYTMFVWTGSALWTDLEQPYRAHSNTTLTNGRWYHLAVVYDGTLSDQNVRESIYVDGVLDSVHPAATSFATHMAALSIGYLSAGASDPDPNAYFVGRIDEVAIWNRPLGADEIKALAQATGPL